MMFLLQCPKCRNRMKYQSMTNVLAGKRKVCVYCGFSMGIKDAILQKIPK
ncbi:hypothetical protein HYS48_00410 [Candidatus Woesearchaeota archaeon]|nr:hypothetical protein [Candidatus Woesearchaeota archaeon]